MHLLLKFRHIYIMLLKVSEASGIVLDWMVATCELDDLRGVSTRNGEKLIKAWTVCGLTGERRRIAPYAPSSDWAQGGPIVERESLWVRESAKASPAVAHLVKPDKKWFAYSTTNHKGQAPGPYYGETFLVSAMRCYVASKLGDDVEVPEELL